MRAVRGELAAQRLRRLERRAPVPRQGGGGAHPLLGAGPRARAPSQSGSSAASRSSSGRTSCAAGWIGSIASRTARYELIDYKTGKPKTAAELREDVQLSLYQMGARESWDLETAAQSYYYVLDNEKVPVEHSEDELERVRGTVSRIADGIMAQEFEPTPSPDDLRVLRLPDHLPGGGEVDRS